MRNLNKTLIHMVNEVDFCKVIFCYCTKVIFHHSRLERPSFFFMLFYQGTMDGGPLSMAIFDVLVLVLYKRKGVPVPKEISVLKFSSARAGYPISKGNRNSFLIPRR